MPALLSMDADGSSAVVTLDTPERAVAPGQACVFYDGERLLGGGWIQRAALSASDNQRQVFNQSRLSAVLFLGKYSAATHPS